MPRNINKYDAEQLRDMLDSATEIYLDEGYSYRKACKLAMQAVYDEFGIVPGDARSHSERDTHRTPRCRTEGPRRTAACGTEFDRMFQNGGDHDAARTSGKVLSTHEIQAGHRKIFENWIARGASGDYARQQAERFSVREFGKQVRDTLKSNGYLAGFNIDEYYSSGAGRAPFSGSSRSSRSSHGSYGVGSSRSSHRSSSTGRAPSSKSSGSSRSKDANHDTGSGRQEQYGSSQSYTKEQLHDIAQQLYEEWLEKGLHPHDAECEARKWYKRSKGRESGASSRTSAFDSFDDMRDVLDEDYGHTHEPRHGFSSSGRSRYSKRDAYRPYRTQERRPGGFFSSAYSSEQGSTNYTDYYTEEPDADFHYSQKTHGSSRGSSGNSSRGYRTKERRPGSSYSHGYGDSSYQDPMEPSGTKPEEDLYVLMGVSKSATLEEIKLAHRKLSVKHHPDRVKGGPDVTKAATEKMALINQAWDVLKDKDMRAYYDRTGLIAGVTDLPNV